MICFCCCDSQYYFHPNRIDDIGNFMVPMDHSGRDSGEVIRCQQRQLQAVKHMLDLVKLHIPSFQTIPGLSYWEDQFKALETTGNLNEMMTKTLGVPLAYKGGGVVMYTVAGAPAQFCHSDFG